MARTGARRASDAAALGSICGGCTVCLTRASTENPARGAFCQFYRGPRTSPSRCRLLGLCCFLRILDGCPSRTELMQDGGVEEDEQHADGDEFGVHEPVQPSGASDDSEEEGEETESQLDDPDEALYANLEHAFEELELICLRNGGGGPSSTRAQLSSLTHIAATMTTEPVPPNIKPTTMPTSSVVVAVHAFKAGAAGELASCRAGDMLTVLVTQKPAPAGWLYVRNAFGERGLVPVSYVEERVRVPGARIVEEAAQLKRDATRRADDFQHDVVDARVAKYLHCTVKEWRSLPEDLRPTHLTRLRRWDGKQF